MRSLRWSFPLTIKAIVLDLDGTVMPTYRTLDAIHHINDRVTVPNGPSFIDYCVGRHDFQTLLHSPATVRSAAIEYAVTYGVPLSLAAIQEMSALQERSFFLYEGLQLLLQRARKSGTFLAIYTNTSCHYAITRMSVGLVPQCVDAIWAKHDEKGSISPAAYDKLLRDYSDLLIPYRYSKPDDTPLHEVAALADAAPHEILFVGDGVNDLDVVYQGLRNCRAIFCFQSRGATDISPSACALSARMRPGHVPLGIASVNQKIELGNVEDEIIRLENGFVDLLDLIERDRVRLATPNYTPVVQGNTLKHRRALQAAA
jgi:phosphoglycolate phosphatase-like HAD superfamily hydrolase